MDSPILMVLEACMQGLITMRLFLLPFAYVITEIDGIEDEKGLFRATHLARPNQ